MTDLEYQQYQDEKYQEHEQKCLRCGACCGIKDNDPCVHLKLASDSTYYCEIYQNRFGLRKTVNGNEILCVPIRNILHKTWLGKSGCVYVRDISRTL